LPPDQNEDREADKAAQENELLKRVVRQQTFGAQVQTESAEDPNQQVADCATRRVLTDFLGHS